MKTLLIRTHLPQEFLDVTSQIQQAVDESGIREGLCVVYSPHTTAGVSVNENADPHVREDMMMELSKVIPQVDKYKHAEGNSAAHIKASLVGSSATVPVSGGRLALGRWQGIFFCEFDGPRQREVRVVVTGQAGAAQGVCRPE
jgi:secondary thiamine-phosphate synthase enzyme